MPRKNRVIPAIVQVAVCLLFIFLLSAFSKQSYYVNQYAERIDLRDSLPETDTDTIFAKVEVEASFPGGESSWRQFLEKNLDGSIPTKKKAPAGYYTVIIQFVVDKDGKVSSIVPLTHQGYGMEEEVVRLLRKAPRWRPAVQDGRKVRAYRKQPVTFMVEEEKKKNNDHS